MAKLSSFQVKTLRAIIAHGGAATGAGGGYWVGNDNVRLEVEPEPQSASGIVGTNTIYGLENRGLLERCDGGEMPYHRATRRLTSAALAQLKD